MTEARSRKFCASADAAWDAARWRAVVRGVAGNRGARQAHRPVREVEDASTICGRVARHLAVIQRYGPPEQLRLARYWRKEQTVGNAAPCAACAVTVHLAVIESQSGGRCS